MNFGEGRCYLTLSWMLLIHAGLWLNFRAVAQDLECSDVISASYWCRISPPYYASVNVSDTQPGRVVCTIPQPTGLDIYVKNQFGEEVRSHPILKNYVHQTSDPSADPSAVPQDSGERNYDLEIRWTPDTDIQERLRMLQCEAIFHQTNNYVCKTSVVNINFIQGEPKAQTLSSPGTPVTDCNTVSTSSQITNSNAAESAPERDFSVRNHSSKMALDGAMLIISSLIYIINFINAN